MKQLTFRTILWGLLLLGGNALYADRNPYVSRVLEYRPAPGQFINTGTSAYKEGYTAAQVRAYAETLITQRPKSALLSLGAFGGSITVGFDHTIVNVKGDYDFKVYGNAFYSARPVEDATRLGGSCEPGIVMVSYDANGNGKPDDVWYELAGSDYYKPSTRHHYQVTYYRPENDEADVRWEDNSGNKGVVERNRFHRQNYYPKWIDDQIVVEGTCLTPNAVNEGTDESQYWVLYACDWGYADNHPNDSEGSNFKIEWAVDDSGKPVDLPGVDFIKIYTGVMQTAGWLGETSTEFCDVEDLHPDVLFNDLLSETANGFCLHNTCGDVIEWESDNDCQWELFDLAGISLQKGQAVSGIGRLQLSALPAGIYTLRIVKGGKHIVYKISR